MLTGVHVVEDLLSEFPEEVWLVGHPDGGVEVNTVERTGQKLVFAYSSPELLVQYCGEGQPAVTMSTDDLRRDAAREDVALFALDVPHPEGHRYGVPDVRDVEPLPEVDMLTATDEVYIPARRYVSQPGSFMPELYADENGKMCLPAYTSERSMQECCGPYQQCAVVNPEDVALVFEQSGAETIQYDVPIAEAARHQRPVDQWNKAKGE